MAEGDWEQKINASDALANLVLKDIVSPLIALLKSPDTDIRNASALTLREIGNNSAVEPLFDAINNPANRSDRSTLVYALERLDCSRHFLEIVELALSQKADVHMSAMNILMRQGFYMSNSDVKKAISMLKKTKGKTQDYELIGNYLKSLQN